MLKIPDAIAYFAPREGRIEHMYLDSVGLVTVAIGRMVSSAVDAQSLPFVVRGTNLPATPEAIAMEWDTVKQAAPNKVASYYKRITGLSLPAAAIEAECAKNILAFESCLRVRFPKFDSFPDSVQLGIVDMIYSVGEGGLFEHYPRFCKAVDAEDWATCAAECHRKNVSDTRNADCAALFTKIPT